MPVGIVIVSSPQIFVLSAEAEFRSSRKNTNGLGTRVFWRATSILIQCEFFASFSEERREKNFFQSSDTPPPFTAPRQTRQTNMPAMMNFISYRWYCSCVTMTQNGPVYDRVLDTRRILLSLNTAVSVLIYYLSSRSEKYS